MLVCVSALATGLGVDDDPYAEAVVALHVNDQPESSSFVVRRDRDGTLLLRAEDLASLRLLVPARGALLVNGEPYYRLDAQMHAQVAFDEATQTAHVTLPAQAFEPTRFDGSTATSAGPDAAGRGGFANYDVSMQQDDRRRTAGGLFELGLFGGAGVLTHSTLAQAAGSGATAARLETTWTVDFEDRLATLRLGDSISTAGAWGRAARFGGLQLGTNFRTQPNLVTTPLLSAKGEALVPSMVDVFVNQRRVASERVPPGPFSIDHLPALTGAGQLQVVVTDSLGRQQVLSQPYYSGAALLRAGLTDYAVEVGALREDYGQRSFRYGTAVGSASVRRGLSDTLTAGARAEAQASGAFAAGAEAAWLAGGVGVLSGHVAAGGDASGSGYLAGFALERNASLVATYLGAQYATRAFRQIGSASLERAPRQRVFAGLGFDFVRFGNLQFAYGLQSFHDGSAAATLGLNYSYALGALGQLGLSASRSSLDDAGTDVLLTWTVSLGDRRTVSTAIEASSGRDSGPVVAHASMQQGLPSDRGFGYSLAVSSADDQDASLAYQGRAGNATFDYSRRGGASGVRLGATGAVALTALGMMPARRLDRSFAVVQVADYEGLAVYLDNQPVGRTDGRGRVLVDALRPYERNEVSVDPVEVPMDGAIDQATIVVTPAYRTGAVVRFPVTRAYAATMRLLRDDGSPVPAGATTTLGEANFPVALDGTLYVEGLVEATSLVVRWQGGRCSVSLRRPEGTDPLPHLGTLRCRP